MINLKYALVGAPTSGKTSVMLELKQMVNPDSHMSVIFIDELASIFLDIPHELKEEDNKILRQLRIFHMQLYIEELITNAYQAENRDLLLLTDRGIADLAVFLNQNEIQKYFTVEERNKVYTNYDRIFYFDIASKERILETISSNPVRLESSCNDILEMDSLTSKAWSKYECMDVIPQQPTVKAKAILTAKLINKYAGCEAFVIQNEASESSV